MKSQFEESQFAVFFQDDLTHRQHGAVTLAPIGQVLEARVGFDLGGWLPRHHPLWTTLGPMALPGLPLSGWNPDLDPAASVTSRALNVFFQFKRSDYLHRTNAKHYRSLGGPYWRFRVDRSVNPGGIPQHEMLELLEQRTSGQALVRYVAPLCHRYTELETLCHHRQLLEHCVYVAPTSFAPGHTTCAFTSPTSLLVNPDPERARADDWGDVLSALSESARQARDIDDLIFGAAELAQSLGARRYEDLGYPWRISQRGPYEDRRLLQSYATAAELFFRLRVRWLVALSSERD